MSTSACGPHPSTEEPPVGLFYRLALFTFAFPLVSPAIGGTVVYPFLLYGFWQLWRLRFTKGQLYSLLAGVVLLAIYFPIEPAACLRFVAFALGSLFVVETLRSTQKTSLMLRMAGWHAVVVLIQLLVVVAGIPLDFSELLRAVYGPLLPPTGIHIDYNAFSQFDIFVPRVAGINREPAYACVLFLGMGYVAVRRRRFGVFWLLVLASLCTLSKILFPLLAALVFAGTGGNVARSGHAVLRVAGRLALFIALNLVVLWTVAVNVDLVKGAMVLDNSYFHRFIGLYAMAVEPEQFAAFGNSQKALANDAIFADYEFVDDKRAFLDGSALSKVAVDLGWVAALLASVLLALIARSWRSIVALTLAGLFINYLSVAPATLLVFCVVMGLLRPTARTPADTRSVFSAVRMRGAHA